MLKLALIATILFSVGCATSEPSGEKDHKKQVDEQIQPLLDGEAIVGCVVGIYDNGRQEVYAYGELARGSGQQPAADTVYEIGSMTKAFTGTLLGDMVHRGEVSLDTPLQEFMPEGVKIQAVKDHPIRLVDLASQSSGLPRMPDNFAPKDPKQPYVDYSADNLFAFLGKYKLTRPPGEFEYSNLGMGLLGTVLARQAGKSYEELVVGRICTPLEMTDTRITLSDDQKARLAPPYNAELRPEVNWDFDALAGCGAMRSTVNDLLKLIAASVANDDRPVVTAIHKAMEKHYGKSGEVGVGLGWLIARDGVTRLHDGQTGGYSSVMLVYPPKKMGVVVLTNTANSVTSAAGEKILQSMLGMKPKPVEVPKPIQVDPEVLKSYEGTYALGPLTFVTITVDDGKLMAQLTWQDKYQLFAKSETEFYYKIVDAQISFVKSDEGKVEKLILHQNGKDMPAIKVKL